MSTSPTPPPGSPLSDDTLAFAGPDDPPVSAPEPLGLMQTLFPDDLWSEVEDAPVPPSEAYVLVSLIGEGGMGEVWEASQWALHRTVAVKFVRDEGNLRLRQQFAHEANITAGLSHPNILPVYDLVEIKGRTALVMKRVHGQSWDVHLDRRREAGTLDLAEEVQRLVQVCNAVVAAHEGGVLHLDIKPDNVLVGAHGEVLLADWGCAAVFAPSAWTQAAGLPETADIQQISGTPGFMSPEQAAGDGGQLGPQTDVYLLGATLYGVLEGRGLRDSTTLKELLASIAQPAVLSFSAATPRSLRRLCEASLGMDPRQRPATAAAFRDALQHWLDHRASERLIQEADLRVAQAEQERDGSWNGWSAALQLCQQALVLSPDSAHAAERVAAAHGRLAALALDRQEPGLAREHAESLDDGARKTALLEEAAVLHQSQQQSRRAQRWLRRVSAGAAVLVAAALVLVSAFYVDAQRSLRQSEALSDFNGRILSAVRPEVAAGLDTTLFETILEGAQEDARETFAEEPALQAAVLSVVGDAYLSLERRDAARTAFQEAKEIKQAVYGEGSLEAVDAALQLWQAGNELDRGTAKQLEHIRALVDAATGAGGETHETTLAAKVMHVKALRMANKQEEAFALAEAALADLDTDDIGNEIVFELRRWRAALLADLGRNEEALAETDGLLAQLQAGENPDITAVIQLELDRNNDLSALGRHQEALTELDALDRLAIEALGADSVYADRVLAHRFFVLHYAQREGYADAEAALGRYFDEEQARLRDGEASPRSTQGLMETTQLLNHNGRLDLIVAFTDTVLETRKGGTERTSRPWIQMFARRASSLGKLGRTEEARSEYEALLRTATEALGWNDRTTLTVRNNLGALLFRMGDNEGAARLHLDNLEAREETLGADHQHTAYSALNAARALEALGETERAQEMAERVVETMNGPAGASLVVRAARVLATLGRHDRARDVLLGVETDDADLAMVRNCQLLSAVVALDDEPALGPAQEQCRKAVVEGSTSASAYPRTLEWRVVLAEAAAHASGAAAGRAEAAALLANPPDSGDWEASLSTDAQASLEALRRLAGR